MRYQGKYTPSFPRKYKGRSKECDLSLLMGITYKFMKWCDVTPSVQEWGSEEIIIPYISPVDGKRHRYFPDFYVKISNRKYLVEVKPLKQTKEPKDSEEAY